MGTWRRWVPTFCLGLLGLALGPGALADPPGAAAAQESPANILAFLQQVQAAASQLDYNGVYVYQQGNALHASRVAHLVDGMGEHERVIALDGAPRECLRHNGEERCLHPKRRIVVERPARSDHFPGLLLGNEQAIAHYYEWAPQPHRDRVAGRDCQVSDLIAKDPLRYGYRICTDSENHLLLRSQTIGPKGRLIDQVAFSHIRFGAPAVAGALDPGWDTKGWQVHKEHGHPVDLNARGWRFSLPAGFLPIAELSRVLGPHHDVDQLVLSDGLAAISVFIETFDPKRDQTSRQGDLRQGPVSVYRMRLASWWLTAVGEVPGRTVRDLARAVQYAPQVAR